MNAAVFLADYTDENPEIAKELARFQRPGVPLVLVYPGKPQSSPIVLPTVLTPAIVEDALARAAQ
jgi:thiol:disulfide interchange protein DsbD